MKSPFHLFASLLLAGAFGAGAAEYSIDTAHSDITFKVKHMGISTVTGKFERFGGTFDVDPKNVKAAKGNAAIEVASINTGNAKRDGHLKGDDFFDAANHPSIKFTGKEVKDVNMGDSTATLVGDLTIRGVTKPVSLKIKGNGILPNDGWGNERAAFHATGTINRFDYGLKWNKAVEAGRLVAGDNVDLILSFEGVRKASGASMKSAEKSKDKTVKEEARKAMSGDKKSQAEKTAEADTAAVKGGVQSKTNHGY